MTKKTVKELTEEQQGIQDLAEMDPDQQIDILVTALEQFCERMDSEGVDAQAVAASLFILFQERMSDLGDREGYEQMLEQALDTEWPEQWLH